MEGVVPDRVVAGGELAQEQLDPGSVSRRRGFVFFGDFCGTARNVFDGVLAQAAEESPSRRGAQQWEKRHRRDAELRIFFGVQEDFEDPANRRVLTRFVEFEESVDRGNPHVADFFALQEPLERTHRVDRRKSRKTARRDLAHARIAIEQHRDERFSSALVLNEREQRHRVRPDAVIVAFERFDQRCDGMRTDDRQPRARAVNLFGATAPESSDELGNLGCPGPKRHLK